MKTLMNGTVVEELSDGEEMVVDDSPTGGLVDPRNRSIGHRRLTQDDDEALPKGGLS
jgi:hypothetical protein